MCLDAHELVTLSEAQAKLNKMGLKQGTPEYLAAAQNFIDAEMQNDKGEPLFFDWDSHGERKAAPADLAMAT